MSPTLKIDFVAPPFAGHLFPQLQLAKYAKEQGYKNLRMYSCPCMQSATEKSGIEFVPIVADREADVLATSHRDDKVHGSIKGMLKSVTLTLDFQRQFADELRSHWQADRPDLLVLDSFAPIAGAVADELGIPWWTTTVCPMCIEIKKGTPGCLGGLQPKNTLAGKVRDAFGRGLVRFFKKAVFRLFRKQIQALGFKSVYREDGTERMYSSDVILGLGISELQYRDNIWSEAMRWIGPCPDSPVFDLPAPQYEPDKKHIFVSFGTQIPWAKERAEKVFREVALQLPEYIFHFILGNTRMTEPRKEGNLHFYGYLPYTPEAFRNYDVLVNHGGTGVMYASMLSGVPQLIWPQDFDQPDNAAQIDYHKAGLRTKGKVPDIVAKIKELIENDAYRNRAEEFRQIANRYQPGKAFVELLQEKFP